MHEIERNTGGTSRGTGYKVAASVTGKGLEDILTKFNSMVVICITTTVKEAMQQYSPSKESGSAVNNVESTLIQRKSKINSLKNQFKQVNARINRNPQQSTDSGARYREYWMKRQALVSRVPIEGLGRRPGRRHFSFWASDGNTTGEDIRSFPTVYFQPKHITRMGSLEIVHLTSSHHTNY